MRILAPQFHPTINDQNFIFIIFNDSVFATEVYRNVQVTKIIRVIYFYDIQFAQNREIFLRVVQ